MADVGSKHLKEIHIASRPIDQLQGLLDSEERARLDHDIACARKFLAGRVVWNINSTAVGGGVAEMLQALLAYTRGAGVDARWVVIRGDKVFFRVTKRLHNFLHGDAGDGGPLGAVEKQAYQAAMDR